MTSDRDTVTGALNLQGFFLHETELHDITCHVGSHCVTCYPTQVNAPRPNPSPQAGTRFGGAEIASTGKCKYGKVKYKVAKCVRVENTSTEYSSTAAQGWKMQVWKNRVRNNSTVTFFANNLLKGWVWWVRGCGSHRRGQWKPTGGQGPRPCSREGARRGWRTHDCSII